MWVELFLCRPAHLIPGDSYLCGLLGAALLNCGDTDLGLMEYRRMGDMQALARLAVEPTDAFGLLVVYQKHRVDLRDAVIRYMRVDPRIYRRAIINVLLGIARHAHQYDPDLMDAAEWIRCAAASEARRLRRVIENRH